MNDGCLDLACGGPVRAALTVWLALPVACAALVVASSLAAQTTVGVAYGQRQELSRTQIDVAVPAPWSGSWGSLDWSFRWVVDLGYWRSDQHTDQPDHL